VAAEKAIRLHQPSLAAHPCIRIGQQLSVLGRGRIQHFLDALLAGAAFKPDSLAPADAR
jgi:hypothetical protein